MSEMPDDLGKHYNNVYERALTPDELENGRIKITDDPYLISLVCGVTDPALQHILKKAIRGEKKGHCLKFVLQEIIGAAQRRIDIIDGDKL
jgi:hypothetical protein